MKKTFFLILFLLSLAESKAQTQQHSDLYNYIMNTVKPTHFAECNTIIIYEGRPSEGFSRDNQPVLVLNDVVQMPSRIYNVTNFVSLDVYTRSQLQSVYIWGQLGDVVQGSYALGKGSLGIIFVYTTDFVFPNGQGTPPRVLEADHRSTTRIVVYERP